MSNKAKGAGPQKPSPALQAFVRNWWLFAGLLAVYGLMITAAYALRKPAKHSGPVDIVLVFDTTSSMQPRINGCLAASREFADTLHETGADWRIAIVTFGAINEPNVIRDVLRPTDDLVAVDRFLKGQAAQGGGMEDQPYALVYSMENVQLRARAKRIFILITDEEILGDESVGEPLDQRCQRSQAATAWPEIVARLKQENIAVYSVTTPVDEYKDLATETGGRFYDINATSSFSDIIVSVGHDIARSITR